MKKKNGRKDSRIIRNLGMAMLILLGFLFIISNYNQRGHDNKANNNPPLNFTQNNDSLSRLESGILKEGKGIEIVKTHCTSCHSAKLIVQNRATREGWLSMIRWMQQTQNLWDLGEHEAVILDYLTTHYPPEEKGRRENLKNIEWYELKKQ